MLEGLRVLVVEDEAFVAMLIEDVLAELGCAVMGVVASVPKALELLRQQRPDAAVLDVNLRGENAEPVAAALRQAGIPFVFATGYGRAGVPAAYAAAPVLAKPFVAAELASALRQAIDGKAS